MMGTILVFLWDKGINRGFLKELKNKKLGINVKSDWVVKRGQEKKTPRKKHILKLVQFVCICNSFRNILFLFSQWQLISRV